MTYPSDPAYAEDYNGYTTARPTTPLDTPSGARGFGTRSRSLP